MRVPFSLLLEFTETQEIDPAGVAEELTLKSVETSTSRWDLEVDGVISARIVEKKLHPSREIWVYTLDTGSNQFPTVVSSDGSLQKGDVVLFAPPNSRVGHRVIKEKSYEGIISQGMMLSAEELGLDDQRGGVLVLDVETRPGVSASQILGLGEILLEVEPTPNRGDLLSVRGLAREVCALLGLRMKTENPVEFEDSGEVEVKILSSDCKRYRAAVIQGLTVKTSPLWLRKRLWQCGLKTINNVVDITNYIMLLEGQPLHAFDLSKVNMPLVVRDAMHGETIETLMGSQKALSPVNLLIADSESSLAIAGVVGGANSSVGDDTHSILLESAYFDPFRIRKSARTLGIQTESSYRFERGVDIEGVSRAQDRAINLILHTAGGSLIALRDIYPEPYKPRRVFLSYEKLRKYSGESVDEYSVQQILQSLNIQCQPERDGVEVYIPSHRSFEMHRDVDVIEEILRTRGYHTIKTEPLRVISKPSGEGKIEESLKSMMVNRGFCEVVTFSFEDLSLYEALSLQPPQLEMVNPLTKSQRFLRSSLVPSLIRVCIENNRNYNYSMAIFEIGKVFSLDGEEERLGFLMSGYRRLFPEEKYEPYDGLSLIQDILRLFCPEFTSTNSYHTFLHPNLQRTFLCEGMQVAFFGVLNPAFQERLGIKYRTLIGEVSLKLLRKHRKLFQPYSNYPPAVRDISLSVDKGVDVDKLISHIRSRRIMEDVRVFSIYTDPRFGEGKKSVSLRMTLRSHEGTLSDQQVNEFTQELLKELEEKFGAKLR